MLSLKEVERNWGVPMGRKGNGLEKTGREEIVRD